MSFILLVEQTAPETPSANQVVLYPKSDGLLYSKDDAGTETPTAIVVATQAQLEAATTTTVYSSPGRQQFHPSAAKGWCQANTVGAAVVSYNVTSVTDTAVGDADIVWNTDFSSGNYCAVGSPRNDGSLFAAIADTNTTSTQTRIRVFNDGGILSDPSYFMVLAFGDQA